MGNEIQCHYADSARRLRELGFPRVAEHLERGDLRSARNALSRFSPASFGEAMELDRAKRAMPQDEE